MISFDKGRVTEMKEYEVVHEIFNQCSGNQMRDVFIEEAEISGRHHCVSRGYSGAIAAVYLYRAVEA